MNICVDIQAAITQRAGVGRYVKLLTQHLGAAAGNKELTLFYFDFMRNAAPPDLPNVKYRSSRWCPGRIAQMAWQTIHWPPFNAFAGQADLYHFPNFIMPPLSRGKAVVTIHDMSFMRFPQFAEKRNRNHLTAGIHDTVQRADAIITDSQFSVDEINELLNVEKDRLFPVHLGVEREFQRPGKQEIQSATTSLGLSRPYILTVNTLEPRKNIPFLIDVFEKLTDFDGDLVIAGMPGWQYEPILARMRSSKRASNIIYLNYVPDTVLPALYAGAELFALTSFYEGFGLPPLEAMACGTPVISSNAGSLPEILGPAAVFIDEFKPAPWTAAIMKIISDTGFRQQLITKGLEQASGYSWTKTALETWKIYEKVCK